MQLLQFQNEFPFVVKALLSAKKARHLSHSFIIHSDDSTLAADFAVALAQAVSCPEPVESGDACGKCQVCRQLENRTYAELFTLAPVSKSRQITIGDDSTEPDTMRWFQSQFYLKSVSSGKMKIGIIHDADCMNQQVQNCFLKTLEEPPPSSLLILLTPNPFTLLPTIRSRCQNILLLRNKSVYDLEKMKDILPILNMLMFGKAEISTAESCASELISISGKLHDIAEEKITDKWKNFLTDTKSLESAGQKLIQKRFEAAVASEYIGMRDSFLSMIHAWFAHLYMLSQGIPADSMSNPELVSELKINPEDIDPKKAYRSLRLSENLLQTLQWNVNGDLALREFCMNVTLGVK
jgi:DNA polymerase-3 subunit delta'